MVSACDGELYFDLQAKLGVDAGISDDEMREIDGMLADYLAGDSRALTNAGFGERALAHMEDVFDLFELARLARNISLAVAIVFILSAMNKDRALRLRAGALIGCGALLLPLAAFAVWAVIDFAAAFEGFHKILFSNDLWLLDPDAELLIRMLPEEFFIEIGKKLALRCALAALAVPLILCIPEKVKVFDKLFSKGSKKG